MLKPYITRRDDEPGTFLDKLRKIEDLAADLAQLAVINRGWHRITEQEAALLAHVWINARNARVQYEHITGERAAETTNLIPGGMKVQK